MRQAQTKTGPLSSSHLHKGPALLCVAATPRRLQRTLHILWRDILWRGSLRVQVTWKVIKKGGLKAAICRRRRDYFFFLEVFFATFLVAAFAVFFAFFAFLAMSSSVES